MSWDEQPEHEVDGPGGDLITWDEVEDAADELDEEIAAVEEESPQVEAEADLSEEEVAAAPATPARRASRAFAMVATPALADRVRLLSFLALTYTVLNIHVRRPDPRVSRSPPARPQCLRRPRTTTPRTDVAPSA